MKVDLDKITSQLPPWDLVLSFGGKDYPVRSLNIYDLKNLQQGTIEKNDDIVKFLCSLFEGTRPDIDAWPLDAIAAAIAQIGSYVQERLGKSSRIIKDAVSQQVNAQGNS